MGRDHRQLSRPEPNRALANDRPAVFDDLVRVVRQIEHEFHRAENGFHRILDRRPVVHCPRNYAVELMVECSRASDKVVDVHRPVPRPGMDQEVNWTVPVRCQGMRK